MKTSSYSSLCILPLVALAFDLIAADRSVTAIAGESLVRHVTIEPATADVQCIDSVALVSWSQVKIHNLNHINDALLMKIQVIMGRDMSKKIEKKR